MTRCRSACKESTEPMTYAFSSCECGGLRVKTLGLDLAYRQGDGGRQIHDLWMGPDVQRVANWGERHDYSSLKICNSDDKTKEKQFRNSPNTNCPLLQLALPESLLTNSLSALSITPFTYSILGNLRYVSYF